MSSALQMLRSSEPALRFSAGAFLVWRGLSRRSVSGVMMAVAGGALLKRAFSGQPGVISQLCDHLEARGLEQPSTSAGRPAAAWQEPADAPRPRATAEPARDAEARVYGGGTRDLVEEASWQSFPASDPPAY